MPSDLQNIDVAIKNALERKVAVMSDFLNDPELTEFFILDGEDWETGDE